MTIHYEITRWSSNLAAQSISYEVKHRADAARLALRRAVYDLLEGNALLDRPIAYDLMRKAECATIRPKGRGYCVRHIFEINNGLNGYVELWAIHRERAAA